MEKRLIVIVDDEKGNLDVYEQLLSAYLGQELEIISAMNGLEARDKLKGLVPDLIITDYVMPGWNGLQLMKYIRSQEALKEALVIMISSMPVEEQVRALGGDFFQKPAHFSEVCDLVLKRWQEREQK